MGTSRRVGRRKKAAASLDIVTPLTKVGEQVRAYVRRDTPEELVAEAWMRWQLAKRLIREADEAFRETLVDWIDANHELEIGDLRLYVGAKRTEKVRDMRAAVDSALTVLGGDVDRFLELLSSNALKPGACGSLLGKGWRDHHFEVTVTREPKTNKPIKRLMQTSVRFQRLLDSVKGDTNG